ncbi:N-acyl-L-amino acid amidohydrolase [Sulfurovum lithotrophicum]|uniref:N-acyl-L-amino acid amidohydrolase n=1 Tax=Sulfurovum lithotrophicum TaxID=206403 RepID=A0A7U4LZQ1_9BACT|nr:amidohydrolase [Sulfurovum lithotrophicum]AKF24203.1 N-acyl-L-amino acid amidohydrolase [Sulfurovum lithotrophicum]
MKNIKNRLFETIEKINDRVIDIRHDLHAHPELSGHEEHTKYLVKGILEASGYAVRESEKHFGLIADLRVDDNARTVAIRADMDALPIEEQTGKPYSSREKGIMHACGHDSHTAIALGTAIAMAEHKEALAGNVRFIFQPSEESKEGGSVEMIADGALEGVDGIFGLHAYPYLKTGQIGYKYGVMMASADIFSIEVFGKSAHGARPHEGVDAILVTAMIVNSLNHIVSRMIDPLHPAVISLGTIEGGRASNIICDHVLLKGTVRTINESVRNNIPKMMEASIKGISESMGATYNFDYEFGQPELINYDKMVDIIVNEAKGIIGEENCIDLVDPVMGGEDFSEYLKIVPGAFFRLGTCNEEKETCVSQHNSRFDVDDDALQVGMKIMGASALSFLVQKAE